MRSTRETHTEIEGLFPILTKATSKTPRCVLGHIAPRVRSLKTTIELTANEVLELNLLAKEYGYSRQGWIIANVKMTRSRRAWLRAILYEAGCDYAMCEIGGSGWAATLHSIFHKVMS